MTAPPPEQSSDRMLTIDEFAAEIGMTTRTVRSYQARGLLPSPVRIRRTPMYGSRHLARMRSVLWLQNRRLPLEAIKALLEPDLVLREFLPGGEVLAQLLRNEPELLSSLLGCGVVVRRPDGGLVLRDARAVLAAGRRGAPICQAMSTLANAVTTLRPYSSHALAALRRSAPTVPLEDLTELAVEAFRLAIMTPHPAENAQRTASSALKQWLETGWNHVARQRNPAHSEDWDVALGFPP